MNEEQKNIETCLPENILAEVASVPQDPQFRSLVNESLDPLKQQALQQAGYDGYEKVVWTHKPYTFTSSVKQMKSNLILLLRRLWRFPFGRGTIRSLADMWQHYITRLKGNAEYGIPSRLDQLTDLTDAPSLLADRKITNGVFDDSDGIPDGCSMARLFCDSTLNSGVTKLIDNNTGWTLNRCLFDEEDALVGINMANIQTVVLGCSTLSAYVINDTQTSVKSITFTNLTKVNVPVFRLPHSSKYIYVEDVHFPVLEELGCFTTYGWAGSFLGNMTKLKEIDAPNLKHITSSGGGRGQFFECIMDVLEKLVFPSLEIIDRPLYGSNIMASLKKLSMPSLKYWNSSFSGGANDINGLPNLIHLEVGNVQTNINVAYWSPTNSLDASRTDLIEEGSTAQNNLQQFLENFRDYIALRLKGGYPIGQGPILTLSQAVHNAITAAEDDYHIREIITQKGWTISPAPN